MKRAIAPLKGFEAREIDKNLFSWMFDKKVVILRKRKRGEQPSTLTMNRTTFWVRIYELSMVARNTVTVTLIAGKIGELLEIDSSSLVGFTRSVRVTVKINHRKPLKWGIHLELRGKQKLWI
ncbi:hypothetical protein ACS0TY_033348 [Phlomoides rotata]